MATPYECRLPPPTRYLAAFDCWGAPVSCSKQSSSLALPLEHPCHKPAQGQLRAPLLRTLVNIDPQGSRPVADLGITNGGCKDFTRKAHGENVWPHQGRIY